MSSGALSRTAQCQAEHCLGQHNFKLSTVLNSTMSSGALHVLDSTMSSWALSWTRQCQAEHCLGKHNVKRSTVLDSAMSSGALHVLDSTMSSWALSWTALSHSIASSWLDNLFEKCLHYMFRLNKSRPILINENVYLFSVRNRGMSEKKGCSSL